MLKNENPNFLIVEFDMLDDEVAYSLMRTPKNFERQILESKANWVFVDEVQRVPALLNYAHRLIENHDIKFIFSGSSARKLKRGGANLLAGRAFSRRLFPLTHLELASDYSLSSALQWGSLPKLLSLSDKDKSDYLRSYVVTYVKEEIVAEQVLRKIEPFQAFLECSAAQDGKIVNSTNIARDVGVDPKTVQSYYSVLEDTWMGFSLPAFHKSIRKAQKLSPKFFWFDGGVARALLEIANQPVSPGTSYFGDVFESYIINEFYRLNHYLNKNFKFSYFALQNGGEVDLILSKTKAPNIWVEIKSSNKVDEVEVRKLRDFVRSDHGAKGYYLSQDQNSFDYDGIRCVHWMQGMKEIFEP